MAISFDRVLPGDVLYDVRRRKMGNTTMSETVSYTVKIIETDTVKDCAFASWNSNPPKWMGRRQIEKLRRSPHKPKSA